MPRFDADRAGVIIRAVQAGVTRIVTIGIDLPSSRKAAELAKNNPGVFAAVGIHPESARSTSGRDIESVAAIAGEDKVIAIGEIGLDFYHDYGPKEKQVGVFRLQLGVASLLKLPVVIHSRQAEADLIPVLKDWLACYPADRPGVIHCFNGTVETAQTYLQMGFYISIGGYIGYPSAKAIREVARQLPIDRLLLETDSPFLPPQSHRGGRNEPAYVMETAIELARIKGISPEEVAYSTTRNAKLVFGIAS